MNSSLYTVMSAAKQFDQMQAVASNNIANANTSNFKADQVSFKTLYLNGGEQAGMNAYTELSNVGIDMRTGNIEHTNRSNDILAGEGLFFALKNVDGDNVISRSVTINKNNAGMLIDALGRNIQGITGENINVGSSPFWVDSDGSVRGGSTGKELLGQLKMFSVANDGATKNANGELVLSGDEVPQPTKTPSVLVGYVESSNVDSISEMTKLMSAQRNYEISAKMMKTVSSLESSSNQLIGGR
ncbi:flagellar basal body rod C-terminal domain-containing protein [Vibrio sp. D431a]|uniref:flagellar basal body rod C-terminal domain-containing protein n=1 Tax=Vibrio sp. D431a TaxID=2837388 RepID=UPI0025556C2B|nr:flagellar basal body rod C-terminal domain-containing protein [Vibrio sp. D431a]MDK9793909.1 hypothetical protein [Vibrio sp. D431a]